MIRFKHTHSSGFYKGSIQALHRAVLKYAQTAQVITLTEVATEGREDALAVPGFGVVVGDKGLKDDSAIVYDKSVFKVIFHESYLVSHHLFKLGGHLSSPLYAQNAVLEHLESGKRVVVSVCHFPSGVEGDLAHHRHTDRVVAWHQATNNLRRRSNQLKTHFKTDASILAGDWNINFKHRWARAAIKVKFPMWKLVWSAVDRLPSRGTHGSRLIDGAVLKGLKVIAAYVDIDDNSSDHGPWSELLKFI